MSMTLGDKIRLAREAKGWIQDQLAEACGVEPPTVSRWENNLIRPRPKTLLLIAEKTGKPVEWFQPSASTAPSPELEARLAALEKLAYPETADELQELRAENAALKQELEESDRDNQEFEVLLAQTEMTKDEWSLVRKYRLANKRQKDTIEALLDSILAGKASSES